MFNQFIRYQDKYMYKRGIMSKLYFKKPVYGDISKIKNALNFIKHNACDYSAAGLILWAEKFNTEIAFDKNDLYIKYNNDGDTIFCFPFVKDSIKNGIENIKEYSQENSIEFKLGVIEPEMYKVIDKLYPNEFCIDYSRDNADYVYSVEALSNLSGKKYHGKKNHINKFKKTYDNWCYEKISDENAGECIEMIKKWGIENEVEDDEDKADEIQIMINGIINRENLGLKGGLIRANSRVVAVTLGEEINNEIFDIHFEKAFADVQGAYPMINWQFIINELMEYKYVNREEDMGILGLRKAKESYNPEFMVQKGLVTLKYAK